MIVVESRYEGSGLGDIFGKIFNATAKNAIKKAVSSSIAHKIAEAVVNGAVKGTEKLAENVIVDLKRPRPTTVEQGGEGIAKKKIKINISDLINSGSGIVLD